MSVNAGYPYAEELGPQAQGQSVLDYLSRRYRHSSREVWSERLMRGEVELDGRTASGNERLRAGGRLVWNRPGWQEPEVPLSYAVAYRDEALLAVVKPGGLPTLPGGGFLTHTLLALVQRRFPGARPLHRLGRGTSGLVLFALTRQAASTLAEAWREGRVGKQYRALASGVAARDEYDIYVPIGPVPHPRLGTVHAASPGGKAASSTARVLERRATPTSGGSTLFEVEIQTGRPHQIRIHLASIGHPLLGDPLYGPGGQPLPGLPGLPGDLGYSLHAERLRLTHPLTGEELELWAPAPPDLQRGWEGES